MVSDLEKTIVDAVSKPQLCGGIIEVGKAIYHSKERTELQKLFYYLARNGSNAAKKRYLFLSDLLGLDWTSEHERMRSDSGSSISLLDPTGPDKGIKNSNFGLKINIDGVRRLAQINRVKERKREAACESLVEFIHTNAEGCLPRICEVVSQLPIKGSLGDIVVREGAVFQRVRAQRDSAEVGIVHRELIEKRREFFARRVLLESVIEETRDPAQPAGSGLYEAKLLA